MGGPVAAARPDRTRPDTTLRGLSLGRTPDGATP